METSHAVITAGNAPTLSGLAETVSGSFPNCSTTGGTVTLLERRYGEAEYREIATTQTDSSNRFRFVVRPLVQTSYQASFQGVRSKAATVSIQVHRRLDINRSGQTFAGQLLPAEAPIRVGLAYIDGGGRYRYLAESVSNDLGEFTITPSRLPQGTFTYVLYTSPRQGLLRATRSVRVTS
jgi:hypothetical protein